MAIEANGTFTLGDIWTGSLLYSRKVLIPAAVIGVLLIGFGVILALTPDEGRRDGQTVLIFGIFICLYLWPILFFRSYRTFKKTPNLQGPIHFRFDDQGLSFDGPHASSEMKWGAILKWKESKSTFLVYQNPRIGSIIPKRFFSTPADVDGVRELLRTHVPRK